MRWKNTKWRNHRKYKCPECRSVRLARDGFAKGQQRYRCLNPKCGFRTIVPLGARKKKNG